MPVAYQSVVAVNTIHCHATSFDRGLKPWATINMSDNYHFGIAVQPPSRVQVGTVIPPIIAKISPRRPPEGFYFYALAQLIGPDGNEVRGAISHNSRVVEMGISVEDTDTSSRRTTVFVFSNLSIAYEGTYSIRLGLYRNAYEDLSESTYEAVIESTRMRAVDSEVPRSRLCELNNTEVASVTNHLPAAASERAFIRRLRDAGTIP